MTTKVEINKDQIIENALQMQEVLEPKPQKKYKSIIRHGKRGTHQTLESGKIVVQEKLDGANASFKLEDGIIRVFSRNQELDENNTLRGFYNWVQENIDPSKLLSNFVYFGEWLVQHKVQYGEEYMKQFYLFDVYNELVDEFADFQDVSEEAKELGINLVPVYYIGDVLPFEQIKAMIGKSLVNPEVNAEGVVVKNIDYRDRGGNQLFTKIVSDEFAEASMQKKVKAPQPPTPERLFVDTFLTKARVEKMMHKLVDEGIVKELSVENMKDIIKNAGNRVIEDMIKEENDELPDGYDDKALQKAVGKVIPQYIKEVLKEIGGM